MSCVDNVCGTGGWSGPKPGDPDNNLTLSVVGTFGGIDLVWTFPTTFPYAVAYTEIYRGTDAEVTRAIRIARYNGDAYFDRVEPGRVYYYWIRVMSVNGTLADYIGPGWAEARPSIEKVIQELTGKIDASLLAQELKTSISGLATTNQQLYDEIQARLLANTEFADALGRVQSGLDQAMTYVDAEITERQDGDAALVESVNLLAAANANALAAIDEERLVRVGADDAMAQQIDSLIATVGDNTAGLVHEVQVHTDEISALSEEVTRLGSTSGDSNAALEQRLTTLTDEVSALSSDVTTVEVTLNGDTATGQVGLTAKVDDVTGEVYSMYTAKVETNGLIGGFGLANDGVTVDAGFDVDRFWIGRTGPDKMKPFIIVDGQVYINEAVINHLEVSKITSGDMDAEWRIRGLNGRIVMDNGTVMKVIGTGFGANRDLIEWFGPSMGIAQCTKANAMVYLGTDGSAYYGGSLRAGTLYNAQRTTQTAPNAQVPLGPFWSNGNPRLLAVSYNFEWMLQNQNPSSDSYVYNGGATYADIQLLKGSTLIASSRITGSYELDNQPDGSDTAWIRMGGSFTFTDTGPAGDYTYTAVIVARSLANITHTSGSSTQSQVSQSLGIVSTEE